jgi:hypothetical protein
MKRGAVVRCELGRLSFVNDTGANQVSLAEVSDTVLCIRRSKDPKRNRWATRHIRNRSVTGCPSIGTSNSGQPRRHLKLTVCTVELSYNSTQKQVQHGPNATPECGTKHI